MRILFGVVVAVLALAGREAMTSKAATAHVRLVVPRPAYRAGQSIEVTFVNSSSSQLLHGLCLTLQRARGAGWVTVRHTHGVPVPCSQIAGVPQSPHTRGPVGLALYDDLRPGEYRISLRYKPTHGSNLGNLTGPQVRSVSARLTVLPFRPGPRPVLRRKRILAIAEQAARRAGDPKPTLIQHAEGTRFEAVWIGSEGDIVFAWNWSYLIAIRGHFTLTGASRPPGAPPPTGSVITLVVDARTGQVTDSGAVNHYPHLAKVGPVTTDLRRS